MEESVERWVLYLLALFIGAVLLYVGPAVVEAQGGVAGGPRCSPVFPVSVWLHALNGRQR